MALLFNTLVALLAALCVVAAAQAAVLDDGPAAGAHSLPR